MKPRLNINESFICRIWEGGESYFSGLVSTGGEDIEVISYGKRNHDSGPDYKDAVIKINGKTLTGDVEIHRDFKNWDEHKHSRDRKYNRVILHVVLWDSIERKGPKLRIQRDVPTIVLANHLKASIHDVWQDIISKPSESLRLPCYNLNDKITDNEISLWLSRLGKERLKLKTERLKHRLNELQKETGSRITKKENWEQMLYEFTFEALGFSKNKEQMLRLSSSLRLEKLKSLLKNNSSAIYMQAVLFGAAGFMFDVRVKDEYIDGIKKYWRSIEDDKSIPRLNRHEWNFFRMRPQNFPTIRLAYGSQVIKKLLDEELFRKIISAFESGNFNNKACYNTLSELLKPKTDKYWEAHYDLGKASKTQNRLIGRQRIEDIIVNVIIPLAYHYGTEFKNSVIKTNVLSLYQSMKIKPDNSVVKVIQQQVVKSRNIRIDSPANEQAAIQLYNFYCMRERCNECGIGKGLFMDSGYEYKIIFY